tara:strand:- start:187 stop:573 length:387 start_codon:yes stop_codon:yes gene_type:complete
MLKLLATPFTWLLRNPAIVLGLALGGLWLWHGWRTASLEQTISETRANLTTAQQDRDRARQAAQSYQDALANAQYEREQTELAIKALQSKLGANESKYDQIDVDIRGASAQQDGPVAPVLRQTIEALP